MTFGFDLEGTMDAEIDIYQALCKALVDGGHTVVIITAYWSSDGGYDAGQCAVRQGQANDAGFVRGIHYSDLVCVPGSTVEEQGANKRGMCIALDVCLMFEDRQVFTDEISKVTRCLLMQPRI